MIDKVQPLFHRRKIFPIKFTIPHIFRHVPIVVRKEIVYLCQLPFQFSKARVQSRDAAQCPQSSAQCASCAALKIIARILITFRQAFRNSLAVYHQTVLLLQLLILARFQICLFYLL